MKKTKIKISSYFEEINKLVHQWMLLQCAIRNLRDEKLIEGLDRVVRDQELDNVRSFFSEWENAEFLISYHTAQIDQRYGQRSGRQNIKDRLECAQHQLNQNTLVQLTAYFEAFLKKVHGQLLYADPGRFLSDRQAKVSYGDVFDPENRASPFEKFLRECIEKEVKTVDRMGTKSKLDYFNKKLETKPFTADQIKELDGIVKTRNKIVHEPGFDLSVEEVLSDPDGKLVTDDNLIAASTAFTLGLFSLIQECVNSYPDYFKPAFPL